MAYVRKYLTPGGQQRWRAEVRVKGAGKKSKTFFRKIDADDWARKHHEQMQRVSAGLQGAANHTLSEAVERYTLEHLPKLRETSTVRGILSWWDRKIGERFLASLSTHEIANYRQQLLREPIRENNPNKFRAPVTVQKYVVVLSHMFSLAVKEWGWIATNPVENVKKLKINNERTRYLSDFTHLWPNEAEPRHWDDLSSDEKAKVPKKFPRAYELPRLIQALLDQTKKSSPFHTNQMWAYYLFTIQISAGLRLSEATHMVWEENEVIQHPIVIADMAKQRLVLKSTKHDTKPRIKPISGAMFEVLKELYDNRRYDTPLVFARADGKKPFDFRKRIRKAIADAKLEDFRWHDLRHTTASYLSMMGASQREIMEALHHRTIQSSQRYTHLSSAHMRGLMDKFSEKILKATEGPSRF